MPWPKIGITHYHAQLGFSDKGSAIKELVTSLTILDTLGDGVCYTAIHTQSMFKVAWRGLVPETSPRPQEAISSNASRTRLLSQNYIKFETFIVVVWCFLPCLYRLEEKTVFQLC